MVFRGKNKRTGTDTYAAGKAKEQYSTSRRTGESLGGEMASLGVLTGIGTAIIAPHIEFLEDMRDVAHYARHTLRTTGEMAYGPAGQRAVEHLQEELARKQQAYTTALDQVETDVNGALETIVAESKEQSLDSALRIVGAAAREHEGARAAIDGYFATRVKLVDQIADTYARNETFIRQAERLGTQIEGGMIKFGEAMEKVGKGVKLSGFYDWFRDKTGLGAEKEHAAFDIKKQLYDKVLEFYHSREKDEATTAEFLDYLRVERERTSEENERLNKGLDIIADQVDARYETENHLFSMTDKVSLIKGILGQRKKEALTLEDIARTETKVDNYRVSVDEAREEIETIAPLEPYVPSSKWIDIAVNPFTLALATAAFVQGVSKMLVPTPIYQGVRNAIASPLTFPFDIYAHITKRRNKRSKNGERD